MKKPHLMLAALLVLFVIAVVGGLSKMGPGTPVSSGSSSNTKTSSDTATPKPTINAGIAMTYSCVSAGKETTFHSLKEVWAHPDAECTAKTGTGTPSKRQERALEAAYGDGTSIEGKLVELYQLCASISGAQAEGAFIDLDAKKEMLAAYTLCVEHPNGATFDKILAEDAATTEKADAEAKAAAAAEAKAKIDAEAKAKADAAAKAAEAAGTMSQQNALRAARDYLDYTAFSRPGLIGQLEYEKYSTEDATWAVDRVTVDWNAQAAKSAKDYLEYTAFSRTGLVEQLLYEGFTPEQAEYGVSQTGL